MRKLKLDELNRLSVSEFQFAPKAPVVVVMDNVRSMHNVGSVLRTSDAFKVERVCLCGITPQPPHREIRKTAIGAEESVKWEYHQDAFLLVEQLVLEGYEIVVIEQTDQSQSLADFRIDPEAKYALVFGHEVDGVTDSIVQLCQHALEIPQYGTKHSLNISVAAGIVIYKFVVEGFEQLAS